MSSFFISVLNIQNQADSFFFRIKKLL